MTFTVSLILVWFVFQLRRDSSTAAPELMNTNYFIMLSNERQQTSFDIHFSYNQNMKQQENYLRENDYGYSLQYVQTGQRPQNFILNTDLSKRYEKYPKAQQLMQEKKIWINQKLHPSVFIKADLKEFDLGSLGKFDAIYCDPPWAEYQSRAKQLNMFDKRQKHYQAMRLEELKNLKVQEIADEPSFIFLWVGSEHLEDGRELLKKWGFKRCEDIVWAKTNKIRRRPPPQSKQGILMRVKEHCLVGYKGQSKKASDHNFIHPNIDIDVVIDQQPEVGSLKKPNQLYQIIQRFCLGRKKIELFGCEENIRKGWLTIGWELAQTVFNQTEYESWFQQTNRVSQDFRGGRRMGTTSIIESLRPRDDQKNDDEGKKSINSK